MHRTIAAMGLGLFIATAAWAAGEAQNPVVKERQALMSMNAASAKVLGDMASGKTPFDASAASEAIGGLTGYANLITDRFDAPETDPASKAKPEIWTNRADFADKADALFKAALMADVSTVEGVQAAMGPIGEACKSCHTTYRSQ